jgi:uncharacterized OB-fold protein
VIEPEVTARLVVADADGACRLLGHRCATCGVLGFPRAGWCSSCGAADPEPVELGSAGGELFGWTEVGTAPPGYEGPVPYGFGIVELDDGIRVLGRLDASVDVASLSFGQRMRCVLDPLGVWAFALDEGGR